MVNRVTLNNAYGKGLLGRGYAAIKSLTDFINTLTPLYVVSISIYVLTPRLKCYPFCEAGSDALSLNDNGVSQDREGSARNRQR